MPLKKSENMNTIIQQFKEQFPDIFPANSGNDKYATYAVLHHYGVYCAQHFEEEKSKEILNTLNKVYQQKNLFACNAIENEFFAALAEQLGVNDLMKHLKNIPENLWSVYIKVLIETQKNTQQ
jgi:hypothetical protein